MQSRWSWANDIWQRHFAPLARAGLRLERVDRERYWAQHETELRHHFPPEVYIDTSALRSEHARAGQLRLAASRDDNRLRDFCLAYSGEALAAAFCGEQKSDCDYRMWHTNIATAFRRRGFYQLILEGTLGYTAELGFDTVVSEHAPGNNAVLIAKLKAGFRITGLDVQPTVGTSVLLTYFHNPEHLAAYEFRCGLATLTPSIVSGGSRMMRELAAQLRPLAPEE